MARAGFNPRQSIPLWEGMAKAGGARPPEILSTHPAPQTRIDDLGKHMTKAVPLYEKACLEGKNPQCS